MNTDSFAYEIDKRFFAALMFEIYAHRKIKSWKISAGTVQGGVWSPKSLLLMTNNTFLFDHKTIYKEQKLSEKVCMLNTNKIALNKDNEEKSVQPDSTTTLARGYLA